MYESLIYEQYEVKNKLTLLKLKHVAFNILCTTDFSFSIKFRIVSRVLKHSDLYFINYNRKIPNKLIKSFRQPLTYNDQRIINIIDEI